MTARGVSESLSQRDARRMTLRAQGLLGPRIGGGPLGVLQRLRAVQLDTIAVLARSHELVPYARLGAVPRLRIERAYWNGGAARPPQAFEHWSRAACILPIEDWPYVEFQRADRREKGRGWHRLDDAERHRAAVLKQLASEGPQTARQLGGAKRGGPWWDWSDVKIAVEQLLEVGDVVCTSRIGFQRVYDLPERAIPGGLLERALPRHAQVRHLLLGALRALAVATVADLAAYCGIRVREAGAVLAGAEDVPRVTVEGWRGAALADPAALDGRPSGLRSRPVLLSPFDSTIWYRPRVERVFGFHHRLEAYVPRPKRVHGYFSMPLLVGDTLVGRADPGREGGTLVARGLHLEDGVHPDAVADGIAAALAEAARWVGATSVTLERVEPRHALHPVAAALAAAGLT